MTLEQRFLKGEPVAFTSFSGRPAVAKFDGWRKGLIPNMTCSTLRIWYADERAWRERRKPAVDELSGKEQARAFFRGLPDARKVEP